MKKPNLTKNVTLSVLYQVLTMVTPLVTAPYIARVLGAEGVGIHSFTSSIQSYFLMFAVLGTGAYGSREVAIYRDDPKKRSQLFWEIEILTVLTTTLCLVGWGAVILLSGENSFYFLIQTLSLVAVIFEISWFYSGLERFDYTVILNIIVKLLSILCIFLFVRTRDDLPAFILISSGSVLLANVSMWIFLPGYIQKPDFSTLQILPHLKNTLVYFVPTVATSIYTVLDKTMIGIITNDNAQNGYYEQATKIINLAKSVAFIALNNVMVSRMSYLYAKNEQKEIKAHAAQSMGYICFMGVGMTFGLIAVARRFVPWFFGPEYMAVVPLLQMFSPIILIIGISNCLGSHYYTPVGLKKQSTKYLLVGSLVNLILNSILIPIYESWGATLASLAAELVITVLYVMNCNGFITPKELWQHLWKKGIAALVMVFVIQLMDGAIDSDVVALICEVPAGVLIFCVVQLLLKDSFVLTTADGLWKTIRNRFPIK